MKPVLLANFKQRPVITKLPDETLMAFFMRAEDDVQQATTCISGDNGYSWSEYTNDEASYGRNNPIQSFE